MIITIAFQILSHVSTVYYSPQIHLFELVTSVMFYQLCTPLCVVCCCQ